VDRKEIMRAENVCKDFPGVRVLDNVNFDLREGEVHILLGENGAGKSTLMKILSGLYSIDEGQIYIDGKPVHIHSTWASQELGISIIYQEFNLIPELTVAQNIFLGREPVNRFGNIDKQYMVNHAKELMKSLNVDISPNEKVKNLGVAYQQLVEVAKAISQNARILIMDEPTAALSDNEIENLFEMIRSLQARNVSIIYISHRLQEIAQIGDRVTVLRDGHSIGTYDAKTTELDFLISKMVGRVVSQRRVREINTAREELALEVKGLSDGKLLKDVSFNVHKGEIVALSGLVGAGRTETVHSVFGVRPCTEGTIRVFGETVGKPNPRDSIRKHIGLLPESRKENGLALILPISKNITESALGKIKKRGFLDLKKEADAAREQVEKLNIVCNGIEKEVVFLSGGNQQKVVLGKWLFTESELLIFDEPTRGIDVGAREEIYHIMNDLASQGVAILMISSDLPEVLAIADRVYVMREGRIAAELPYEQCTQETIISYATGGNAG